MNGSPPVAAVLLAAGSSRRFRSGNKLLCDWNGTTLIRHVAETLIESCVGRVVVATGYEAQEILEALKRLNITAVQNPRFALGMGSTIAMAVQTMHPEEAVLIAPGDMPWISSDTLNRIVDLGSERAIVVPCHGERDGNPVLFPPDLKPQLLRLSGDHGARSVVQAYRDRVTRLEVSEKELEDVDSIDDLQRYLA